MEKKMILKINSSNVKYENEIKYALKDVNLKVYENEIISIIGESGSGKTTLAKYILGLNEDIADSKVQEYTFNDIRIDLEPEKMKKLYGDTISMVLQDPVASLNPTLKIGTQIQILLKEKYKKITNTEIEEKIEQIFKKIKIENYKEIIKKYPIEISGGMNQRINIALSLIKEPKLLIMDEPTSAIDADNRLNLIQLIKEIQKERKFSIIFITHDILLAQKIADRIIVMKKGKIVEEIIKNNKGFVFNNEYTKVLYNSALLKVNEDKNINKEILVKLKNVVKQFNNNTVINNISFNVLKNETLGLIGKSGSGKTTICKLIMGVYKPTGGYIKVSPNIKIEMVYQNANSAINPNQTIYKILNEENYIKKRKEYELEEIQQYLKDFNLPEDILKRKTTELSGGQKQIINIIRALLNKPDIIILDEPTSSLDVLSQKKLLDLLNYIKIKYSLTYIIISHDDKVIKYMCDRYIQI